MSPKLPFDLRVQRSITSSIEAKQQLLQDPSLISVVGRVSEACIQALRGGNKLLLFGNGGSAADTQHIATEIVGRFAFERPALPALALSVDTSALTAVSNDYGFDHAFSRQVEALGREGDVALGFSTSGNSPNVLRAISSAKKMKLHTVAFTGRSGGQLRISPDVDDCVSVPSDVTARIQECHLLIGHIICELVEEELFHAPGRVPGS
ncbi:MAG TPA: D-sedoheptulose 7-phosphate isomerase [Methylomirabilota bacterium]|nr:D-sedoheptulose 7-phosphate isomerase [Methylomirabilota bacterium]